MEEYSPHRASYIPVTQHLWESPATQLSGRFSRKKASRASFCPIRRLGRSRTIFCCAFLRGRLLGLRFTYPSVLEGFPAPLSVRRFLFAVRLSGCRILFAFPEWPLNLWP